MKQNVKKVEGEIKSQRFNQLDYTTYIVYT